MHRWLKVTSCIFVLAGIMIITQGCTAEEVGKAVFVILALMLPGIATDGDVVNAEASNCSITNIPLATGQYAVDLPAICTNNMCSIYVFWEAPGFAFGAVKPGFFPPTFFFQRGDNSWRNRGEVNIAGIFVGGVPSGNNGDGVSSTLIGGGFLVNGDNWSVLDDSGTENDANKISFNLTNTGSHFTDLDVYICR